MRSVLLLFLKTQAAFHRFDIYNFFQAIIECRCHPNYPCNRYEKVERKFIKHYLDKQFFLNTHIVNI